MLITPSFKKSLIVEQFHGSYLKNNYFRKASERAKLKHFTKTDVCRFLDGSWAASQIAQRSPDGRSVGYAKDLSHDTMTWKYCSVSFSWAVIHHWRDKS